ncbi:MAG TPA: ATP synthase F0 subunit C [Bdellovibrionota bacterium]|nr:ATP synthase F0 subunit C [Bdellovibrionota bacterium]
MCKWIIWKKVIVGSFLALWVALPVVAFAEQEGAAAPTATGAEQDAGKSRLSSDVQKWLGFTAGIAIAVAAFGGALGQSRVLAAAVTGISRNPGAAEKMFLPWMLGLVFIESLVIYAWVIAFVLALKF